LKIPVASRENTEDKFPFKCYFCDKSVSYKEAFGIYPRTHPWTQQRITLSHPPDFK